MCVFFLQTTQGVQVNCFRTLGDLVLGYQQPHKGLVIPLLYPVVRETELVDESSGKTHIQVCLCREGLDININANI